MPVTSFAQVKRMAELSGRVGDGINTRAAHPRRRELIEIARNAHARAGRDPARFVGQRTT